MTGKIANEIVPINSGWFKPQKFKSSFVGKYAVKSELQTLIQSILSIEIEGFKYSFDQGLSQQFHPIAAVVPDV